MCPFMPCQAMKIYDAWKEGQSFAHFMSPPPLPPLFRYTQIEKPVSQQHDILDARKIGFQGPAFLPMPYFAGEYFSISSQGKRQATPQSEYQNQGERKLYLFGNRQPHSLYPGHPPPFITPEDIPFLPKSCLGPLCLPYILTILHVPSQQEGPSGRKNRTRPEYIFSEASFSFARKRYRLFAAEFSPAKTLRH